VFVQGNLVTIDPSGQFRHDQRLPAKPPYTVELVDLTGNRTTLEFPAVAKPAKKAPPPKKGKGGKAR